MSIYKRGKVYWSSIWVDGVRQLRSLETTNRRRAEAAEMAVKEELHIRRFQSPQLRPDMTFGELFVHFLDEGDVKGHHVERGKHFLPFFSEMPIGTITRNDMARYRKHRHEEHLWKQKADTPKPLSEATVNRDVSVIRHLLFWAADEGFIPANPIARIRLARERRQRRPVMSIAEEANLLASCADHLRPVVITALDTGMRRGEVLNQRWEHVDFDRKLLAVTHSKTPEGEMREIPLTHRVFEMLSASRQPSGPLFTYEAEGEEKEEGREDKKAGAPIHSIKTGWAGALRRAGIAHYRFHDLRHTFNSRLVEVGVIADVRKELMGHSRGGDVHSIYTHVELPVLREAIAKLEAWHTRQTVALSQPNEGGTTS